MQLNLFRDVEYGMMPKHDGDGNDDNYFWMSAAHWIPRPSPN